MEAAISKAGRGVPAVPERQFDFEDLFIFDLANNHQGDVDHASRIIRAVADVAHANGVRAALKFQFRDLDTFVHPTHREDSENRHIPRFLSTRLADDDFARLTEEVRQTGLVTMCTPFDEPSVAKIVDLGIEVVKVASCSAVDWPLLEAIAESNKPVVASTGGLTLEQVDDIVSFFDHRRVALALEHCVSIYPTPQDDLELEQIALLKRRHPSKVIGFSTHEDPADTEPVIVAVAKGASILERHVGIETETIELNAYSSTPEQLDRWIKAALRAKAMVGAPERQPSPDEEREALASLQRGVYAARTLKAGDPVTREDVYFAAPYEDGQLPSGRWTDGIVAADAIAKDEPLQLASLEIPSDAVMGSLFTAIHSIKALLNEAKVALNTEFELEFSHHYGLDRFTEVGATIITCINRSYCKKLIVQLPGQRHPLHYHKRKEETFQVLYGVLEIEIEGRRRTLQPGDIQLVQQGVWHRFWTDTGVIFEEISTTHYNDDSFYEDKTINRLPRDQRKTVVNNWGRYQLGDLAGSR
jgi:N-acetylneuraminate synthase